MSYMQIMIESINLTEELGKSFADIEKLKVYSNIANESSNYYTLANESIGDTIKNIGKTIAEFFKKIYNFIKNLIDRFIDFLSKKKKKAATSNNTNNSEGTKEKPEEKFFVYSFSLQTINESIRNYSKNANDFYHKMDNAVYTNNFNTEPLDHMIENGNIIVETLSKGISDPDEYRKHFKAESKFYEFSSRKDAEKVIEQNISSTENALKNFKNLAHDWEKLSRRVENISLRDFNKINEYKTFIAKAKEAALVQSKILTTFISLLRRDIDNTSHIWTDEARAKEFAEKVS